MTPDKLLEQIEKYKQGRIDWVAIKEDVQQCFNSQNSGKPNVICRHDEICVITEIPTDGISRQQEKVYVKCLLCDEFCQSD
jgi:hypothetical protein